MAKKVLRKSSRKIARPLKKAKSVKRPVKKIARTTKKKVTKRIVQRKPVKKVLRRTLVKKSTSKRTIKKPTRRTSKKVLTRKTSKRQAIQRSIVIKRRGNPQKYEEKKIYAACFFSCKNAHLHDKKSEQIASKVSKEVTRFIRKESKKRLVTSTDIFIRTAKELKRLNKDAAFLFATHRDIS